MQQPAISVLLSVYNGEEYIREAIESILNQTFGDFEFLIVDDCSTDNTVATIELFKDPRIHLFKNDKNSGLTKNLNFLLKKAKGKYIARMDADDISLPHRFEKQYTFLEQHSDIGIVGTARTLIDSNGFQLSTVTMPSDDLSIRWMLLLNNPFVHPSVMIRHNVLQDHDLQYDDSFITTQDYEFWSRLLWVAKGANLEEPLLLYRIGQGIKVKRRTEQIENTYNLVHSIIQKYLPSLQITKEDVVELQNLLFLAEELGECTDPYRISATRNYIRLFKAFSIIHKNDSSLNQLKKEIGLETAKLSLRLPWQSNFLSVFWESFCLCPSIIFPLMAKIPLAFINYIRRN